MKEAREWKSGKEREGNSAFLLYIFRRDQLSRADRARKKGFIGYYLESCQRK